MGGAAFGKSVFEVEFRIRKCSGVRRRVVEKLSGTTK
jgi:hypothetical protein